MENRAVSEPDSAAIERALRQRKAALELEIRQIQTDREAYYLIIDLSGKAVHLKSSANLLRTCPVQNYRLLPRMPDGPMLLHMVNRVHPVTPIPGERRRRLRGRRLPVDFVGRLVEGPREATRLYLTPSLVIQPTGLSSPSGCSHLELQPADVKALASALQPGNAAILIPPMDAPGNGTSR